MLTKNNPFFEPEPRYLKEYNVSREELYAIQEKILDCKDSTDLEVSVLKDSDFKLSEIKFCLEIAHSKGLIKGFKIKGLYWHYYYKYDYPDEKMFEWEKLLENRNNRP